MTQRMNWNFSSFVVCYGVYKEENLRAKYRMNELLNPAASGCRLVLQKVADARDRFSDHDRSIILSRYAQSCDLHSCPASPVDGGMKTSSRGKATKMLQANALELTASSFSLGSKLMRQVHGDARITSKLQAIRKFMTLPSPAIQNKPPVEPQQKHFSGF
jgi:hypothetical protein